MTDIANKRQEIAKEIRALLMSSPAALTIDEVRRDFHQFMDRPIPFRELGYSQLEDMLRDMTDVLYITYKKGMMCLEVIPDETTRHIAKLVSKQKIPNKNKYATMRQGPARHPKKQLPPKLPHYIRKNINALLRSYSNGLPLTHFDTAYSRRFGSMFSFSRLGFVSMKELLYSVPDIVLLKEYQAGEWRVLPANHTAPDGSWRTTCKEKPSENRSTVVHEERSRGVQQESLVPDDRGASFPQPVQRTDDQQEYNKLFPYRVETSDLYGRQKARGRGRGMKRSASGGDQASVGRGSESSYNSNEPEIDQEYLDMDEMKVLQTELRDMMAEKTEGIWASQLPFLYKMKFNKLLNFKDLGFMSVIELCNTFPDQIRIERPTSKGDWLLFDARIPKKSPYKDETEVKKKRHNSQKGSDPDLKEKIRQVVMCHKDGIPLGEFLGYYQKLTGESLPVDELGFKSVERFLLSLTDTLIQFKYIGDGVIRVKPLDNTLPQRTDKLKFIPEAEVEVKSTIPDDAILPGTSYRQLELPPLGEYFEVYVSNIVSPGLFWFQIRSKHTTATLEKVMNQIEYCYKTAEGNQYKIPDELLVVGLVVAAVFPEDDNYHRCIVTKLEIGPYVQVYFVDYGNTCNVHKSKLRLLRSKFLKLPIQAIQGRLANIQPNGPEGEKWTMSARNKLLDMCINTPLVALATADKHRVMSLVLVNTCGEEDICYNDTLVHEGYAIFKPDDYTTVLTGPVDAPEVPDYSYVYGFTGSQSTVPDTSSVTALSSQDTEDSDVKQRNVKESFPEHLDSLAEASAGKDVDEGNSFEYGGMDQDTITLSIDTLQFKRKRILQSLMDVTVSQSEEIVSQLDSIEQQISQLKAAYEKAPKAKCVENKDQFVDAETETKSKTSDQTRRKSENITKPLSASISPAKMTNVVMPMKKADPNPLTSSIQSHTSSQNVQNPLNVLTPQQILYQQMLLSQMNQQAFMSPYLNYGQMRIDGEPFRGLNPLSGLGNTIPSFQNALPQMGLHGMGNINPLGGGFVGAATVGHFGDHGNQGDVQEVPLLPGLLPLLQTLNLGRGRGSSMDPSDEN